MLGLAEIDGLERQLRGSVVALNKDGVSDVTLIEAIDDASLWADNFEDLTPFVPSTDIDKLVLRAPLLICGIAAEIGFRFEGVGTEFWAKLSKALGVSLTMVQRATIGTAFEMLASKYNISRPSHGAFSAHFSIISWPIANALLPVDLIGPVARMMARAPVGMLPGPGRRANFVSLRAWASAAEGARLVDWLRFEGPTSRVLGALLTENRGSILSAATYKRLQTAIATEPEAFFATRKARSRTRVTKSNLTAQDCFGQLTLANDESGLRMFVTWPALTAELFEQARATARAAAWRPQLWGKGSLLHPDTALGSGPFALGLQTTPADDSPAYPDASKMFGVGSDAAAALASRRIDWSPILLFDVNDERTRAEQRLELPTGEKGFIWIATRNEIETLELRQLGQTCGYRVLEANLSDPAHRDALCRKGLIGLQNQPCLARHPFDAIGAPHGIVRPDRPFLWFKPDRNVEDDIKLQRLADGVNVTLPGAMSGTRLRAMAAPPIENAIVDLTLFERDAAFEALIERRLQLRVESQLPLVDISLTAELEINECLIARGKDRLTTVPTTVQNISTLWAPLYEDLVRAKLIETGRGSLRIAIGRSVHINVLLQRAPTSIEWTHNGPILVGTTLEGELVSATARRPSRFTSANAIEVPNRGAAAFGLKLSDGRVADPVQILTSSTFDLSDFAANFAEEIGFRRKYHQGRGVGDIARARVAWARGLCQSLPAIAAKTRVVQQFDEPLVINLCGPAWWRAEISTRTHQSSPHAALWEAAIGRGLVAVPTGITATERETFLKAFQFHAKRFDPKWSISEDVPVDGAMDDALNAAFTDAVTEFHTKGKLLEVGEDDFDFGSVHEEWHQASADALKVIRRLALVKLLVPSAGGRQLSYRSYDNLTVAELAEDLSAWSKSWALPRGQLSPELAAGALLLWLSPAACDDVDAIINVLAVDPFVSRATRYAALRLGVETTSTVE